MFGFRKKRDHATAIAKNVAALMADERKMDPSMRRTFWCAHGPLSIQIWLETFEPHADEIAADAPQEYPAFQQRLAELYALRDAFALVPEADCGPHNADSTRSLVLSQMDSYVAAGPTLTFAAEWTIYSGVLASHGLSPRT